MSSDNGQEREEYPQIWRQSDGYTDNPDFEYRYGCSEDGSPHGCFETAKERQDWHGSSPDLFDEEPVNISSEDSMQYAPADPDDQTEVDDQIYEQLHIAQLEEDQRLAAELERENMMASDAALAACLQQEERDVPPIAAVYSSVERDAQAAMDIYTRELAYVTQLQEDEELARSLAAPQHRNSPNQRSQHQVRTPPPTRSQYRQNQYSAVHQVLRHANDLPSNDYEELLMLGEQIGDAVDHGLSGQELNVLPTQVYSSPQVNATASSRPDLDINKYCAICQENFTSGENLRTLPCLHRFHQECMDTWLKTKAVCPICNFDVKKHLTDANS